jgi:membrane-anchored protein YejM (alkaline phosphatase superfamily)
MLTALEAHGYKDNTIVLLWGDHGWHLGDTNSWCKMTNFESGVRNAMLWRVPGQHQVRTRARARTHTHTHILSLSRSLSLSLSLSLVTCGRHSMLADTWLVSG